MQLLLIYCVDIPPQVINITLILAILSGIPPVLLPTVFYSDILLLIQVRIPLLQQLFLQHIS